LAGRTGAGRDHLSQYQGYLARRNVVIHS
jgi:hypothetical protein